MTSTAANPVLHHVTLKTTRLREMADWYHNAVGLEPNHYGPFGAWLTNDAANHRVALLVAPGLDDDPDRSPTPGRTTSRSSTGTSVDCSRRMSASKGRGSRRTRASIMG